MQRPYLTSILIILSFFLMKHSLAQVRLPRIIRSQMVLQRGQEAHIWGWASPGERISLEFQGKKYKTRASQTGEWEISLPPAKAGGPFVMKIKGKKNELVLEDILIGDVWLCAGQSNMVHQMDIHDVTYAQDIKEANFPEIRHFKIPYIENMNGPAEDLSPSPYQDEDEWEKAVGEQVRPFSAVAFFFARHLYEKYQVPIGLINASVGGSSIETWMSEEVLKTYPSIKRSIQQNKDTAYVDSMKELTRWSYPEHVFFSEPEMRVEKWISPDLQPKNWHRINIPGYWEDQGIRNLDGQVWYRREVNIPASMAGKEARVFLGRVIDADHLYINGKFIGGTTYQYPQRRYKVPAGILKAGRNTFVIRVYNYGGKGGFVPDKPYCIFTENDTVDLKGYWSYKVSQAFLPSKSSAGFNLRQQPTTFYNGMLAPITNYSIRGILWYQGESNHPEPEAYADLLQKMIVQWREDFGKPDLPFIYAQLPNYLDVNYLPEESQWATLRESQLKALGLPHTAMTVNIDLGEWNDIHPDNKKDVGERMALAARKLSYGEDLVYSGPIYRSHQMKGDSILLSFDHIGSGLSTTDGEALDNFALAGADKEFVWAKAKIEGDKVLVWSDEVPAPMYLRYAWADNPFHANLCNKEGLMASPFRVELRGGRK